MAYTIRKYPEVLKFPWVAHNLKFIKSSLIVEMNS